MTIIYDAIYLSPHLDDAALSCGGQIYDLTNAGKNVLIVTIMGGELIGRPSSQFAESLHQRWQLERDVVQARRKEDEAACKVLGAMWQHWEFLDCIYRVEAETGRPLYTSEAAIFGEIDTADSRLLETLATRMALLSASQIYVPLTLGHHVDHQLTRQAAEKCFGKAALLYYEDYPYAREISAEKFTSQEDGSWQANVIDISEAGKAARIKAVKCYESQLSTFFEDSLDLEIQLKAYIESMGGEKVWSTKQEQRWIA